MSKHPTGIWSGGYAAFFEALREEEREALSPLKSALEAETDPEVRRHLKARIKRVKEDFRGKRKAAASGLFSKA
jgi:hypothetical protein